MQPNAGTRKKQLGKYTRRYAHTDQASGESTALPELPRKISLVRIKEKENKKAVQVGSRIASERRRERETGAKKGVRQDFPCE